MKPKAKTIIIWDGVNDICITRGFAIEPYIMDGKTFYKGKYKEKNMFMPMQSFNNIESFYFDKPKKLISNGKIMDGWEVVRARLGFINCEPCIPDIPPSMLIERNSLLNEVQILRKQNYDMREELLMVNNKERIKEKVLKDMQYLSDVKSKVQSSYSDMFGGGFGGLGRPSTHTSATNTNTNSGN